LILNGFSLKRSLLASEGGLGIEGLSGGAGGWFGAGVDVSGFGAEGLKLLLLGAKAGGASGRLRGQVTHFIIFSWRRAAACDFVGVVTRACLEPGKWCFEVGLRWFFVVFGRSISAIS
jgi:hypothetical protein